MGKGAELGRQQLINQVLRRPRKTAAERERQETLKSKATHGGNTLADAARKLSAKPGSKVRFVPESDAEAGEIEAVVRRTVRRELREAAETEEAAVAKEDAEAQQVLMGSASAPRVRVARKMPVQKPGKSVQTYATPDEFIAAVRARFKIREFFYDLAAEPETTKGLHHYCEEEDALAQDWTKFADKQLWLNPPFGGIAPWATKCADTTPRLRARGGRLFFLTPASVGANWFAEHVHKKALVLALQGRLSFDGKDPYPKDCMLSLFGVPPGFEVWDWQKDIPKDFKWPEGSAGARRRLRGTP
jgi:phage N-6-adenine-methyltransferase